MPNTLTCADPKIIVNKRCASLLAQGNCIRYHDRYYFSVPFTPDKVDDEIIDNCTIMNRLTGYVYPVYMYVPCGHCVLCQERKSNSFFKRMVMESQLYDDVPWFLTLTYAPEFLPKRGVSKRDVQLYLKKLRNQLITQFHYDGKIRYHFSAEYGQNGTKRPHYHAIIWNLPSYDWYCQNVVHCHTGEIPRELYSWDIHELLASCWRKTINKKKRIFKSKGWVYSRPIVKSDDKENFSRTLQYTLKYNLKTILPDNKLNIRYPRLRKKRKVIARLRTHFHYFRHPEFYLSSRRYGIGHDFIMRFAPDATHNLLDMPFTCKFSQTIYHVGIIPYVRRILYPTLSQFLGQKYTNYYKCLLISFNKLKAHGVINLKLTQLRSQFNSFGEISEDIHYSQERIQKLASGGTNQRRLYKAFTSDTLEETKEIFLESFRILSSPIPQIHSYLSRHAEEIRQKLLLFNNNNPPIDCQKLALDLTNRIIIKNQRKQLHYFKSIANA